MSTNLATYSCISYPGLSAISKLKADSKGYYRVCIGGFDVMNQSGKPYLHTPAVKALFDNGGAVRRRLDSGYLRGEYKHPNVKGLKFGEAVDRLADIDSTMVSHHFKNITLEPGKDEHGRDIVLVYGVLKPAGPYEDSLRRSMNNTEENVAFSVRSLTRPTVYRGRQGHEVTDVFTYDHVSEPGIAFANKYNTVSMEGICDDIHFTEQDLSSAIQANANMGLESSNSRLVMVKDSLGWNKIQSTSMSSLDW